VERERERETGVSGPRQVNSTTTTENHEVHMGILTRRGGSASAVKRENDVIEESLEDGKWMGKESGHVGNSIEPIQSDIWKTTDERICF